MNFLCPLPTAAAFARVLSAVDALDLPPITDPGPPGGSLVPTGSSTEDLVPLPSELASWPAYNGVTGPRGDLPIRVRERVAEKLLQSQRLLPMGLRLALLDGWRSRRFQTTLVAHYGKSATDAGYVSSTANTNLVPPHTTGGAVDLTLAYDGRPLALGSDFDEFSSSAHLASLETSERRASPESLLRRLLFHIMINSGFAPYRIEWWHYSFGDQHWAARYSRSTVYGEHL